MITISQHGPRLWLLGRGYFLWVSFAALLHGEVAGACSAGADGTAGGAVGAAGDARLPDVPGGALPPDFLMAGGGDVLGCEVPVQELLPLAREGGVAAGEVVEPREHLAPAAIGTACAAHAAGGCGLPDMASVALPPDLAVAVGRELVGRKIAVQARVPLGGQIGMARGEVVLAGNDAAAGADGTAPACGTAGDTGLPAVACGALPPDDALAASADITRREGTVLRRVPLGGEGRIDGGKVVCPGLHAVAAADGAACAAAGAGLDLGLPDVALGTLPPDAPLAAGTNVLRREGAVLRRMPLGGESGMGGGEVVRSGLHLAAAAHGAATVVGGAGVDSGGPGVARLTAPVHALLAAVGDGRRRERRIGGGVPLSEQVNIARADAVVLQTLAHRPLPFHTRHVGQNKHFVWRDKELAEICILI